VWVEAGQRVSAFTPLSLTTQSVLSVCIYHVQTSGFSAGFVIYIEPRCFGAGFVIYIEPYSGLFCIYFGQQTTKTILV
jgi:hypothetical protein